jgi:predicted ribosome-associated RNA-binding protein Tma20
MNIVVINILVIYNSSTASLTEPPFPCSLPLLPPLLQSNPVMFKKEQQLVERSRTLLKNKELKNLKSSLSQQYPSLDEDSLNALLPNKSNLTLIKLANRSLLYAIDDIVLFFDVEGRNKLFPTVHALWRLPKPFLRTFVCHPPVSRYVLRGADFMAPGISTIEGLDNLKVGERCCLCIEGNPLPFAVGESLIDFSLFTRSDSVKGKAMSILHVYGDLLADKVIPNVGFSFQEIRRIQSIRGGNSGSSDGDDSGDDDDHDERDGDEGKEQLMEEEREVVYEEEKVVDGAEDEVVGDAEAVKENEEAEAVELSDDIGDDGEGSLELEQVDALDETVEDDAVDTNTSTTNREEMNKLLFQALGLTLRYIVKDHQLPVLASKLYALMTRSHTAFHQQDAASAIEQGLDVKRSTYRKVNTFFLDCKHQQILDFVVLETGVCQISNVNRGHSILREYKVGDVEKFKAYVNHTNTSSVSTSSSSSSSSIGTSVISSRDKVEVVELWKLPRKLSDIFLRDSSLSNSKELYFTTKEIRDLLTTYMKDHYTSSSVDNERSNIVRLVRDEVVKELYDMIWKYNMKKSAKNTNSANTTAATTTTTTSRDINSSPSTNTTREEDELQHLADMSLYSTNVSSLYMPPQAPEIKMKIHKDGLIDLDNPGNRTTSSSSTSSSATSSIVSEKKAWKPVSLPPAPTASSSNNNKSKPTSTTGGKGITTSSSSNSANKKKDKPATADIVEQPSELNTTKEDFIKCMLEHCVAYHRITTTSGEVYIYSGAVPSINILAEKRQGNKVCYTS